MYSVIPSSIRKLGPSFRTAEAVNESSHVITVHQELVLIHPQLTESLSLLI